MRVSIEITGTEAAAQSLRELDARLAGEGLRDLLAAVAEDWASIFRERITSGGDPAFAALSPASLDRRGGDTRYGGGAGRPLIDTGALRDSLSVLALTDDHIEVGTTLERAPLLHFGGTTAATSRIPNRPVPARPFVFLTDQQLDDTVESIRLFFLGDDPVGALGAPSV